MVLLVFLANFCAAFLMAWGLNWLALIPWRRAVNEHWTAQARRSYPVRVAAKLNVWLIPATLVLGQQLLFRGVETFWLGSLLSAWAGAILGTYPLDRELIPQLSDFGVWLRLIIASWLLQFSIWILFIVVIVMMPDEFCLSTMLLGCGAFALQIWIHCGLWIYLARLVRLLKEPPESLRRIVSQVATQMGRSCRGLWLMDSPISYAAALPMTGDLIFSKPIIADHPDVEIAAICAHEIGHLTESTRTKIGRLAGSFMFFPWLFAKPVAHQFGYPGLTGLAIITVLMMIFARRLARQMEVRADAVAHDHQAGEGIYARALERLYKNNQMPAVMRGDRKAHPHLYDRMLAAGVTPDYPRPAAPPNQAWNGILIWACLGMLGALYAFRQ